MEVLTRCFEHGVLERVRAAPSPSPPFVAERIDDDWDDFIAFLRERRLVPE